MEPESFCMKMHNEPLDIWNEFADDREMEI